VTADLIDQAVVQLRAGATVDDVALVVLKATPAIEVSAKLVSAHQGGRDRGPNDLVRD
jgi:hypothetical protein